MRELKYLRPATGESSRPQLRVRGRLLASDPKVFSSGVATRCHACGTILTVGLGFGHEDVVLVCDCGARNGTPGAGDAGT